MAERARLAEMAAAKQRPAGATEEDEGEDEQEQEEDNEEDEVHSASA